MSRQTIGKKVRFEVFKRDKFTCQYCGRAAPEVVLHVDHIQPVAKDGDGDIINLITSCIDCNLGKGARELSDDATIQKRKRQLDELQERREQLDMMVDWQRGLIDLRGEEADKAAEFWADLVSPFRLTDTGMKDLRRLIKSYGLSEVLASMTETTDTQLERDDNNNLTEDSVSTAWEYVGRIATVRKRSAGKPYMRDLYYIRGILRQRCSYLVEWQALQILENAYDLGAEIEDLKMMAKHTRNWSRWKADMQEYITLAEGTFSTNPDSDRA